MHAVKLCHWHKALPTITTQCHKSTLSILPTIYYLDCANLMWSTDSNCFHLFVKLMAVLSSSNLLGCISMNAKSCKWRRLKKYGRYLEKKWITKTKLVDVSKLLTYMVCTAAWLQRMLLCNSWMILCCLSTVLELQDPTETAQSPWCNRTIIYTCFIVS